MYIRIIIADPYMPGKILSLGDEECHFGRIWSESAADYAFASPYVSKSHAVIKFEQDKYLLKDMGSKHGTTINKQKIEAGAFVELSLNDVVGFAQESVSFQFLGDSICCGDETMDFSATIPIISDKYPITVDEAKRVILIENEKVKLSPKEMELFFLLYQNRSRTVTYQEIRNKVWPERVTESLTADVGQNEVNILIHRLRKKLGPVADAIEAVTSYGAVLNI